MSFRSWFTLELPSHALVSKLSDEERRLQDAMAADLEVQTALAKIELQKQQNELAAIEEQKKRDDSLRCVFTAYKKFKRGEEAGYRIITTWGESLSGRRGRMSIQVTGKDGQVSTYYDEVWTFFTTRPIYTNILKPWLDNTITTDELRKIKFDKDSLFSEWIEFPLTGFM